MVLRSFSFSQGKKIQKIMNPESRTLNHHQPSTIDHRPSTINHPGQASSASAHAPPCPTVVARTYEHLIREMDSGFRAQGSKFRVPGSGSRVQGIMFPLWERTYEHLIREDPERPPVSLLAVPLVQQDFGRHVVRTAHLFKI